MSEPTKNPSNPARTAARSTKRVATAKHVLPPSEGGQAVPDASSLAQLLMVSDWTSAQEVDAILDAAPDSVVVYDAEGRIVRANATFHIFLARVLPHAATVSDRADQIPLHAVRGDLLPEEAWPRKRLLGGETLSGASAAEIMTYTADGEALYWSVTGGPLCAPDGRLVGAVAIYRDITQQKRLEAERERLMRAAQEARAEAEAAAARLQTVLEILPVGVSIVDAQGKPLLVNDAVRAIWGAQLPLSEAVEEYQEYKAWWPETGQRVASYEWGLARSLSTGEVVSGEEVEIETFEGQRKVILNADAPIRDAYGAITGAVSVIIDITERKRLEDALAERVSLLTAIFNAVPDRLSVFDASGEIVQLNTAAAQLEQQERGRASMETLGEVLQLRTPDGAPFPVHELPLLRALRGESVRGVEVQFRDALGREQSSMTSAAPFYDSAGQLRGAVVLSHDVSVLRAAQRAAVERASLLEAVFAAAPDRITIFDETGQMVRLNPAAQHTAGAEREHATMETVGQVFDLRTVDGALFSPEDLPAARALRGEIVQGVEMLMRTAVGEQVVVTSSAPFYDSTGALRGAVAVAHDVTTMRTAEREAAHWAAQLDATFESLSDGAFLYDSSGALLRMNDAARVIFALDAAPDYYALAPAERLAHLQVRDAHDRPLAPEEWGLRGIARGERLVEPAELRITALDGQTKDLAITGGPVRAADGTIIGAVSLLRDVTDQRRLQRAVAEQASQLQAMFDALAEPMCVFDANGRILRQNRAGVDAFGLDTPSATIEERAARIALRDDEGRRIAPERLPARRVLAGATLVGIDTLLLVAQAADGQDHWYMVGGAPIRDEAGRIAGGVMIYRDVTERRLLGQQTRWQASMLERAQDAIFLWELDGPILYWNHGAELLYGYSKEEAVGQRPHQLLQTERPISPTAFSEALTRDGEWIGDIRQTTQDRRLLVVESRHQLLTEPDGRQYVLEVCRDITERLELERAVRSSRDELEQRVVERTRELATANRSLRRLSQQVLDVQERERRAIALELHEEIGQALTGVKMLLEQVEQSAGLPTTEAQQVGEAREVIDGAVEQVRTLSLDLRPGVLDHLGLLPALRWQFERYTRQTGVQVRFSADGLGQRLPTTIEIGVYRLIQEALTNVSRHAHTALVTVQVRVTPETLTLFVVDDGAGFDAEEALAAGRSTGLAGMVERANLLDGSLTLSSMPGEGTTIEAIIPLAPAAALEEENEEE